MSYVIEMVAYKAIHAVSSTPWRSLLDPEGFGQYSEEEILAHLTVKHGLDRDKLEVTPEGEIFLHKFSEKNLSKTIH